MLEQNKCDIRDQHGLEHIFHRLIVRIDDFSIFTSRTMHPMNQGPHTALGPFASPQALLLPLFLSSSLFPFLTL